MMRSAVTGRPVLGSPQAAKKIREQVTNTLKNPGKNEKATGLAKIQYSIAT